MTEYYTPEESQLLVELAIVLASFAGTQLFEEDFPVIGEPSYLQDKYLRQAQTALKVVHKNKAGLGEPVNKRTCKSAEADGEIDILSAEYLLPRAYKSAEELAVERMGDIDNPDMWTTVVKADEEIDIEEVLEHLRQRGYRIEEPKPKFEDSVLDLTNDVYLLVSKFGFKAEKKGGFSGNPHHFAQQISQAVKLLAQERLSGGSLPKNLAFYDFLNKLDW